LYNYRDDITKNNIPHWNLHADKHRKTKRGDKNSVVGTIESQWSADHPREWRPTLKQLLIR
jgi:hypothetical protein